MTSRIATLRTWRLRSLTAVAVACAGMAPVTAAHSQERAASAVPGEQASYARLVRLADGADYVLAARVIKQTTVPADRAPGVAAGQVRLYLEAETKTALAGKDEVPARFAFLADVPLDAKGRAPKLKKRELVLFARKVAGRPGELQLVAADGQLLSSPELQARLRPILAALVAADAPPRVTGVRDVLSTEGNLVGESETQIFLATADERPAAITVLRRPGQQPRWGVSWSELVDQSAMAPARDTLAWYRLACALPRALPTSALASSGAEDRTRAVGDYRFVLAQLGPCEANPR